MSTTDGHALNASDRERAVERQARRTKRWLIAVSVFALAAFVFSSVASREHHSTESARNQAISRQVALEARDMEATDPSLAMQLALVGYRISRTAQATSALLDTTAGEMPTRLLGAPGPTSIATGDDGHELAVAYSATGKVEVYSLKYSQLTLLATVPAGAPSSGDYALAISDSGHLLATGSAGNRVTLWSLAAPKRPAKLAALTAGSSAVSGLSFSPGGQSLAAADADGAVQRWSLSDPAHPVAQTPLVAPNQLALRAVSYSPDGKTIAAVGASGELVVWRAHASTSPLASLTIGTTTLTSVAYSPDSRTLAAGGRNALVYLWKLSSGGKPADSEPPLQGFGSRVDSVTFSRDGRYLAAGDGDNSLRIWSTSTWSQVGTLPHPEPVTGVVFTDGDRHLISADKGGTVRIWQFPPSSVNTTPGSVGALDYTADAQDLAAVSSGPSGGVRIWNVTDEWRPTAAQSVTLPASFGAVAGVGALGAGGHLLAVGDDTGRVRLLDIADRAHPRAVGPVLTTSGSGIRQLTLSSDVQLLAAADDSGQIQLWDVRDPTHPAALPALDRGDPAGKVLGISISPNDQLLAAASSDDKVWLWDIADPQHPKLVARIAGLRRWAYAVTFAPNSKLLIAGSADRTVRLWNVSDPSDPVEDGGPLHGPTNTVTQVAVSPDGKTLAASTTGGQVWLWGIGDPSKPGSHGELAAASGEVNAIAFSPTDNTLVGGGTGQLVNFWHYRPYQAVNRVCALAGTPITSTEWSSYVEGLPYNPPCPTVSSPAS